MKKYIKLIFITIFIITVLFISNLLLIFPWQPQNLTLEHKPVPSDAIVFLSEDQNRINYAVKLYQSGYASYLFSPGVDGAYYNRLKDVMVRYQLIENKDIFIGSGATSTYEEALETRKFVLQNNIKSILLVTSNYHSYRAYWIFRKVLPQKVKIISAPVPAHMSWFKTEKVKKGTYAYKIFRSEQLKFAWYYLWYGWRVW